ncbi:type VII secretion protein EccB [Mycobacterium sp. OAE908]|uniref:type VII secretion protein EccB n=1 Tax=Mycobacterium sp. OAE908 TaxID=2817899 RepID=UPI001AEA4896
MSGRDRREFTSRTPVNENANRVVHRRGFVTRHQVSGWRFVMRRIASGVALHDTRMLVDPLRTQTRAVLVGALVLTTGLAGCFIFSLIRPSGVAGNDVVLADRSTAALYVKVGDQLHPVLNLASARLIAGRPDNPTTVKSAELDKFPRGNLLGIPGAPERLVQNASRDALWTVCGDANPGVTVIAGSLGTGGERASELKPLHAVLASNEGRTWLLWDGRRSALDLADRTVTDALGLGTDIAAPRPIPVGLFNAIPEGPALTAPAIAGAGGAPRFPLSVPVPVGAVVVAYEADNTIRYYAVLSDGLQPISEALAGILRNTNSFGLEQPPRLGADEIARMPVARGIDTDAYPSEKVTLVDMAKDPITCAQWAKPEGAQVSSLTLLTGAAVPVRDGLHTVELVGSPNRVSLSPGTGYFVDSNSSLFWVSDTGVRYGIEDSKTAASLGLTAHPLPISWSVLSQFAAGPTLSRADALLAHDALSPDGVGRQAP